MKFTEPRTLIIGILLELKFKLEPAKSSVKAYKQKGRIFVPKNTLDTFIVYRKAFRSVDRWSQRDNAIFIMHHDLAIRLMAYAKKGHKAKVTEITYQNEQGTPYVHAFKRHPLATSFPDTVTLLTGHFKTLIERGIMG